jgi:hypothetical protein
MNRKFSTILTLLLLLALSTSTVAAAGAIKLSGGFTLGSLHFNGTMTGLGGYKSGVTVELIGAGIPVVLCTNQGGNEAPGQNPPKVTADGTQYIGPSLIDKKGKASVGVAVADQPGDYNLTGTQGGCPNDNWSATVLNILWTDAIINVYSGDGTTGPLLLTQTYACDPNLQTATSLSCWLVSETSFR